MFSSGTLEGTSTSSMLFQVFLPEEKETAGSPDKVSPTLLPDRLSASAPPEAHRKSHRNCLGLGGKKSSGLQAENDQRL